MTSFARLSLALTAAFVPATAFAMEQNIVDPPVRWEDVPPAELGDRPDAGVSWDRSASGAPPAMHGLPPRGADVAPPAAAAAQDPAPVQLARMNHAGSPKMHHGAPPVMHHAPPSARHHGGPKMHHGWSGHGGHRFQRVGRGWRMQPFWWGPRFRVNDWRVYGFPAPRDDWFWVRYYDDALLIDRHGMVHDYRYGVEWDRYGERWSRDDYGVPYYGDVAEDWDHGPAAYGYYGYGYGYGPVVVTETITTTTSGGGAAAHRKYRGHDGGVKHRRWAKEEGSARCSDECCDCDEDAPPARPPIRHIAPPAPPPPVGERG